MKYVNLCGNEVSRLGFGCMRLPERDGKIDFDKAMSMADAAIEAGINYFDTAYVYHNGKSEGFVKEVIKKYGRENLIIADKLPIYNCEKKEDLDKFLDEQLDRLGTDYIDYYLFHCLNQKYFDSMKKFDYKDFIKRNVGPDKKIRHIGFSFHDELPVFKTIIDDFDWEFTQIQLNYLDTDYQAGLAGYEYATAKGMPVIIMEPIRGGRLANIPKSVRKIFDRDFKDRTDAEIALRYVANFSNNKVILNGMNTMSDMEANCKLFADDLIGNIKDNKIFEEAKREFGKYSLINCTACDYCKDGCPSNIPISKVFGLYNKHVDGKDKSKEPYGKLDIKADKCIACGLCESSCPQGLAIIENLAKAHDYFE